MTFVRNYQELAFSELALNGIFRLVTIIETMLGDLVRDVVLRFPEKIGKKKTIEMSVVLGAASIADLHVRATDGLLHDLSYKSPKEFAREAESLISCNLLECPAFHQYVEIKATRDIHIHNRAIANEVYLDKAGSHARAKVNRQLPVNLQYFLQSFESCLQFTEWLATQLQDKWHSSLYESQHQGQLPLPLDAPLPGATVLPAVTSAPQDPDLPEPLAELED